MTDFVELSGTLYARNHDLKIELTAKENLIRELVAALVDARRKLMWSRLDDALAKAKEAGFEP